MPPNARPIHKLASDSSSRLRRSAPASIASNPSSLANVCTIEEHGLIERKVFAEVPPRVEYSLTPLGRSLNEPLTLICEWTEHHGAELERARQRIAGTPAPGSLGAK